VDSPSRSWLLKTGVQIPVAEIHIFRIHHVNEFEICCKCHLVNTLWNVSATPGIVSTQIGSRVEVRAGCPWSGVCSMSMRRQGTKFFLRSGYHFHSSPIIPGKSFGTLFIHSARIFPHKIDSGNPITTFSDSGLHIIAAASEVKVYPSPISATTSARGISASETHLLRMNLSAQTLCA
jgi:hypothetical protein